MTTYTDTSTTTASSIPTIEPADVRGDLDAWDDTIIALDCAMREAAAARRDIEEQTAILERIEASKVLEIAAPNEAARRARLTLELADDARYRVHLDTVRVARSHLADAEARIAVARERCRLYRAALTLAASHA